MGTAKRPSTRRQSKSSPLIRRVTRPASNAKKPSPKRIPLRLLIIVYALLLIGAAASATIMARASTANQALPDPFTPGKQATVHFGLYYPASLPPGYYLDKASLSDAQSTIITMRLTNGLGDSSPDGRAMNISQQAVIPGFNLQTFIESFDNRTTAKSKLGEITVGTIDNGQTRIASLTTADGTWILLNAKANVNVNDIIYVMSHLTTAKKQS